MTNKEEEMDNKEAIKALEVLDGGRLREAVNVAIKALEAQEVSNDSPELDKENGELISRQAAIDVIDKIFPADPMRNDYTQGITCGAALATEYIKQLPSAQPQHDISKANFLCPICGAEMEVAVSEWEGGGEG